MRNDTELTERLIAYGLDRLEHALPGVLAKGPEPPWDAYEAILKGKQERIPERALTSIFSLVSASDGGKPAAQQWYNPRPLALESDVIFPTAQPETSWSGKKILETLSGQWAQVREQDAGRRFESFYHLYLTHAWAVPCTYGEVGVSLFEQWKAVAALAFASGEAWHSGPSLEFTLVGGDIPGIQEFVYTITSKGAAKGLRGRSFFLQLLGDAVVRRILQDLELSAANLVYNAAGNFMIIAPDQAAAVGGERVSDRLEAIYRDVNSQLLALYHGDLSVCLAWQTLPRTHVGGDEFAASVSRRLRQKMAEAKRRRFAHVAKEQWHTLFAADGETGNRYCSICQRPLARGDRDPCEPCESFARLAEQMGQAAFLMVAQGAGSQRGEHWQEALERVAGLWYELAAVAPRRQPAGALVYTLDATDFLDRSGHGFRFAANVTPHVTSGDVARWLSDPQPGEEQPTEGRVRTLRLLAEAATGVPWLGALRMDVDDLGEIMARGLANRSLVATSALSSALDRFFSGWLKQICAGINAGYPTREQAAERGEAIYVIYAGGDDMFAVGAWNIMAELARRIEEGFVLYAGENPAFHLSGGLTLHDPSFPIYQAADQAGEAEGKAKEHRSKGGAKNAMCFLGVPVTWGEWPDVVDLMQRMVQAIESGDAKRALVRLVLDINAQYEETVRRRNDEERRLGRSIPAEPEEQMYYGPWVWRRIYALSRMAGRVTGKAPALVKELEGASLAAPSQRRMAMAARWAELLLRKEE